MEVKYCNGGISGLICGCFCSFPGKHKCEATRQLRETLEKIEKHYTAQYQEMGYFAAVHMGSLFSFAINGKETGGFTL